MATTKSAAAESKKRKRELDVDDLIQVFDTEPDDYKIAWNEFKHRFIELIELIEHSRQTIPSLAPSILSLFDAFRIFNLRQIEDFLWANINELPIPQYLSDNIDRILTITSKTFKTNEAFSRSMIDQILIFAIYEEQHTQQRASSQQKDPAVLELQHETHFQRQVLYDGEIRLLSGYADYTVWYEPQRKSNLSTNLIVIEAKKINFTDTCLGQLTAYMGIAHAYKKDEQEQNSVIYGVASDGFSFRFCRIDNEGNWSQSRLLEWKMGDKDRIYSVFRSLIKIAALSSPSTSPIENVQRRRKFDSDLMALKILGEDSETEIISWRESGS